MALIELDLDAPPAYPPSRPSARLVRPAVAVVAVVLVLALGGAAPALPVLWRRAGLVPLAGASTSYQLAGGILYTLDGNANRRTTTAWSAYPLRKLWSLSTELQLDPTGTVIHDSGAALEPAGRNLLQQSALGTTVIDPSSGRVRWSTPVPLLAHSGGTGVVQQTRFRPGTEYDQSSGDPGPLYWSDDGVPHTRPPEWTVLRGLDLTTGRPRWTVQEPGSVYVVPAGGTPGFVVISADRLVLLAASTGAVLRDRVLPRSAVTYPEMIGDLLILRHDVSDAGGATATAYGLGTFEPRWQIAEPMEGGDTGNCADLPCEREQGGLAVLDPRTGATRWHTRQYVDLIRRGHDALEVQAVSHAPLDVVDPRTGAVRVRLGGWDNVAQSVPDDPIVLFRARPDTGPAEFGVLGAGAHGVRVLGRSSAPVRDCSADARFVACRVDDGVEVWTYRA